MNTVSQSKGFTLPEILVTLVVLSILTSLAIPSFVTFIRNNTLTTSSNDFVSAISYARSEAISRNTRVTVCKRANDNTCGDPSVNWENGWIVFIDENFDGNINEGDGDIALRFGDALPADQTMRASTNIQYIFYTPTGRTMNTGTFDMRICAPGADATNDTDRSRTLNFNSAGRASPSKGAATCP